MDTSFPCVVCSLEVRPRQHALQCDECQRWQHRVKCTPGMTIQEYRSLSQQDDIQWKCSDCQQTSNEPESVLPPVSEFSEPVFESTRNSFVREQPVATGDISFQIEQVPFHGPDQHTEDSLIDPIPSPLEDHSDREINYHKIVDGSQRGKEKLVESTGYSYIVKERKKSTVYWVCSVRGRNQTRCLATVIEKDGVFTHGKNGHVHPACPGLFTSTDVARAVKEMAVKDIFRPASSIVEQVISEKLEAREPCPSLPAPSNLARTANRARQRMRPAEPKDLDFELSDDHIPEDFLKSDVRVGNFRHLVFYTNDQLRVLEASKTWYMDATFSIVPKPFTQMFSLHAFVKSGKDVKQVPLAFVLMSRKRRIDYKKVFKCLRRHMTPGMTPKAGVADFEAGVWQAFRQVFPNAEMNGCSFHWNQAVFRKVQNLGLEEAYRKQDATYKLIRKVMSLPYLPSEHIYPAFIQLRRFATTPQLVALMDYVDDTWMSSTVWPIRCWSVYGRSVRTNNDVEGWHRRINLKAKRPNVQFYILLPLLHDEAKLINLQLRLVSEGKLRKNQRLRVRETQGRLFALWKDYGDGQLSASQLLREVASLHF